MDSYAKLSSTLSPAVSLRGDLDGGDDGKFL